MDVLVIEALCCHPRLTARLVLVTHIVFVFGGRGVLLSAAISPFVLAFAIAGEISDCWHLLSHVTS